MRYFGIPIALATLAVGTTAWPLEQSPLADATEGLNVEVDAPGIGFDLSTSYGTAAIKYRNGTVIDVGKVEGHAEYERLMRELSKKGRPFSPPFNNPFDELTWNSQQMDRKLLRFRGRPSTEEIGILASMISALQGITEDKLSTPVTQVAVTIPDLPMLLYSDLIEAFKHAGIQQVQNINERLDEAIAARMGMGYGLCSNPDKYYQCLEEEQRMPDQLTIAISFTNSSLIVRNMLIYSGHRVGFEISDEKYHLGLENPYLLPDIWGRIGAEIKANAGAYSMEGKIDELLLYGEAAEQKEFLDEVWKVLGDMQDRGELRSTAADTYAKMVQHVNFNATYISARGAAEFALRAQLIDEYSTDDEEEESFFQPASDYHNGNPDGDVIEIHVGQGDPDQVSLRVLAWGIKQADGNQNVVDHDDVLSYKGLASSPFSLTKSYAQYLAGDKRWRIEVVEFPGEGWELWVIVDEVREYVGTIDESSKVINSSQDRSGDMAVIAWGNGLTEVQVNEELAVDLGVDSELLGVAERRGQELSGGKGWWIEVVDRPSMCREIWVIVDGSLVLRIRREFPLAEHL